jgi:hypothetical protein
LKSLAHTLIHILSFVFVCCAPATAFAVDKDYLESLAPKTAERVLMSFQAPLYYVTYEKGANISVKMTAKESYTSRAYDDAFLLFMDKASINTYKEQALRAFPPNLSIKATHMSRILVHMHTATPNASSDERAKFPMVIHQPPGHVTSSFADIKGQPYVHEHNGRRFIPAFLTIEQATEFEKAHLLPQKEKLTRVGLDFKTHVLFVESWINSATPIITFGDNATEAMNSYFKK